ncbi:MAG TPA: hypothetical protein DCK76_01850 [Desulfotomaculum sp.]|nr:MAG: N-acetylneuraminate synthase [Desulfotomaculum sp. 46_296]HAG10144.1 hypothetical protein [Desulfotomaculum sp.]HBY03665.1 hypothetical protein [Desulfotomaculum sp.]
MTQIIKVGNKKIGPGCPVFVIAEIGCNFEGDLDRAKEMIRAASAAGADAVKFQTFIPEKLTTRTAPKFWDIEGCPGETQYDEFIQMPKLTLEKYKELKKTAEDARIIFFSTPEDEDSADLLESIGVPLYKISSMNITHLPLLRHVAKKGKPIIISTGGSTIKEIKEAVTAIVSEGNRQIVILHCITNYPAKVENVNLNMIIDIKNNFGDYPIGYSDHTKMEDSLSIIIGAAALGANSIEKHFTFDKNRPGYDHEISADYQDLKEITNRLRILERGLGISCKKPTESEKKIIPLARRSIVAKTDIPKGTRISKDMLSIKRPGTGIEPKFILDVVGKKALTHIKEDEILVWNMLNLTGKEDI